MEDKYLTSRNSYGVLITPDIKLHRKWFKELTRLIGINVIYKPVSEPNKQYNINGEAITDYLSPVLVGCIFEEHPKQQTTKKLGWNAELQEDASIIHLPYDLKGLQKDCLVIVPSGIDNTQGRVFRIVRISNIMIYPASFACEIVPEYANNFDESQLTHPKDTFNLLNEEED